MKVDLTMAGLSDEARHILQVAANLLGAYRMSARLRDWDGTRCDALFVDALDGYGRSAAAIAQRRGIRVVHFGEAPAGDGEASLHIPPSGPVAAIARRLQQLLLGPEAAPAVRVRELNVVRMALSPAWIGQDLAFRGAGREVRILRSVSRVHAASLSDILYCRDHIDDPGWRIEVLDSGAARPPAQHMTMSLDSFLCQATDASSGPFPTHGDQRWTLQDWPDLGAATRQVAALRLAQLLRRGPQSAADLASASGLDGDVVDRCLWAFRAAGLLQSSAADAGAAAATLATTAGRGQAPAGGVMARLARRFGLTWK